MCSKCIELTLQLANADSPFNAKDNRDMAIKMSLCRKLLAALCVWVSSHLGAVNLVEAEQIDEEKAFSAGGADWVIQDILWSEYNGHWRVRAMATLVRPPKGVLLFTDVMGAICGEILATLPHAPEFVDKTKVYRVELNTRSFLFGRYGDPLFPQALPIQIRQGKCQIRSDGKYFYTYPGVMENWEQSKVLVDTEIADTPTVFLHFRKINPKLDGKLPFREACNAFFADPSPALENLKQHFGLPSDLDGHPIWVVEFNNYTYDVTNTDPDYATYVYRKNQFEVFELSGVQCRPHK